MSFRGTYLFLVLALLHVLLDVTVVVYAARDFNSPNTELLAAALSRSQICLLAVWFVLGFEPFSWRLCGLTSGCCLVFMLFSRMSFFLQEEIGPGSIWREVEWNSYFRETGPGDLLVKMPILMSGIIVPLFMLHRRNSAQIANLQNRSGFQSLRLQFRLHHIIVWVIAISVLLATFFQTGPYRSWYRELGEHWMQSFRTQDGAVLYTVASALVYVVGTLASLWLVYGRSRVEMRMSLGPAVTLAAAYWVDYLSPRIDGVASELITSGVAMALMIATFMIFKVYEQYYEIIASRRS